MKVRIEIYAAEGGEDSALFVNDLALAYSKMAARVGWIVCPILKTYGKVFLEIQGNDLSGLIINEPGGHRLQRVPPTERKGRVHTSTVTVAVVDLEAKQILGIQVEKKDLRVEWYSGSGAGGQNRNKVQNCCRLTHIPSGIVKTSQTRTRESSYRDAYDALIKHLQQNFEQEFKGELSVLRKTQMGSGMRGDKIRTYRFQDNTANDHRTNRKASLTKVMDGHFGLLWA